MTENDSKRKKWEREVEGKPALGDKLKPALRLRRCKLLSENGEVRVGSNLRQILSFLC